MVDAEEESALGEVHQQRDQIVAPLQELRVLALMEVVNANMDFRTAGHPARQLLAEEEIRWCLKYSEPSIESWSVSVNRFIPRRSNSE